MVVLDETIRLNGNKPEKVNWCFMSASQIGQNGRGKLIAVDKATEENCRSCDPDHDRKIHNGECPCCEVIFKFFMGPISSIALDLSSFKVWEF